MTDFTAIYIRVSTDEQAKEGVSLSMQEDLCRKYVELHGLPDDVLVYADEGKSAASLDRPAIDKLRSNLTGGHIRHIVVFKLDRLTRRTLDLCNLMAEFEKYDVALHGVRDKLDTDTPSGRLVLQIMGAVAEWERETIRERVKGGMDEVRRQGFHAGGPAPYGWEAVSHAGPGMLLRTTTVYPHVEEARRLRGRGQSYATVADWLVGDPHPQRGKRIAQAPLISEMVEVGDGLYRYPADTM
jgi:DNA invertase Pin-like site-specific DNA recombinase